MHESVQSAGKNKKNLSSKQSRGAKHSGPESLAQLAATLNHSSRVQMQLKLAQGLQDSSRVEAQRDLAAGINAASPRAAQLKLQEYNSKQTGTMINDDPALEKEVDVMGNAVLQEKHLASASSDHTPAQRKAAHNLVSTGPSKSVVQRMVVFVGGDAEGVRLRESNRAKWMQALAHLNAMGERHPLDKLIAITVVHEGGRNPATTYPGDGTFRIEINDWFIDMSSVEEIVALLVHELGVHGFPHLQLSKKKRKRELRNARKAFEVNTGARTLVLAPTRDQEDALTLNGRQSEDHVNVGRDTGGDEVPPRVAIYANTMLLQGDAIWEQEGLLRGEKIQKLQGLLQSYLFDVARIIATDEGKAKKIFRAAGVVAEVFNWYHGVVLERHAEHHPWLQEQELQIKAGKWKLRGWLLKKVLSYVAGRFNTSRVGRSLVGSGVRGIGRLIGGAGSLAWRGIRGLGGLIGSGIGRLRGGGPEPQEIESQGLLQQDIPEQEEQELEEITEDKKIGERKFKED